MKKMLAVCLVALFLGLGTVALAHREGKDGGDGVIPIYVAPSTIVKSAPCPCVTIHTETALATVQAVSAFVNDSPVDVADVFADSRGNLVVKLDCADVVPLLGDASSARIGLVVVVGGLEWRGEETVTVKP